MCEHFHRDAAECQAANPTAPMTGMIVMKTMAITKSVMVIFLSQRDRVPVAASMKKTNPTQIDPIPMTTGVSNMPSIIAHAGSVVLPVHRP